MKISEKQLQTLLITIPQLNAFLINNEIITLKGALKELCDLVSLIVDQQSDELREVE